MDRALQNGCGRSAERDRAEHEFGIDPQRFCAEPYAGPLTRKVQAIAGGVGSFQCAQESVGLVWRRPQFSLVSLIRSRIKQLTKKIPPTN